MPQVYQHFGIRFQYPDNWTLDEEEAVAGNRSVAVYSPEGGFWSVAVHPPKTPRQPLLDTVSAAMREEYDNLDAEQVTQIVLTGDPYQIDNPYVDATNNGLTTVVERFKGQAIAGTVSLFKGERSSLAELASNLL